MHPHCLIICGPCLTPQIMASRAKALQAQSALEQLLGWGAAGLPEPAGLQRCTLLIEAVISK